MPNKRLNVGEVEQMKKMVVAGTSPEDIAKHFKIAISSVHNWKSKFKEQGVKFPSVRGQRPSGSVSVQSGHRPAGAVQSQITPGIQASGQQPLKFVVNGVAIQVEASAKSVNIGKDSFNIEF